jgi:aryl-alcohol dehydrogenase-like predicted oxidoreductase
VPKANQYAKDHGKTPFSIYQGKWSVLERSFERDIIPMARSEGLALAPWGVLGSGKIRSDAEEARRRETGEKGRLILGPEWERTEEERKVCLVLEQVASEVGVEDITSGGSNSPRVGSCANVCWHCSRHCVLDAQNPIRISDHRGAEG